jgi:hypothetical protein
MEFLPDGSPEITELLAFTLSGIPATLAAIKKAAEMGLIRRPPAYGARCRANQSRAGPLAASKPLT